MSRIELIQLYGGAFHLLLYVLAGITVLSALMVFGFLSQSQLFEERGVMEQLAP